MVLVGGDALVVRHSSQGMLAPQATAAAAAALRPTPRGRSASSCRDIGNGQKTRVREEAGGGE